MVNLGEQLDLAGKALHDLLHSVALGLQDLQGRGLSSLRVDARVHDGKPALVQEAPNPVRPADVARLKVLGKVVVTHEKIRAASEPGLASPTRAKERSDLLVRGVGKNAQLSSSASHTGQTPSDTAQFSANLVNFTS